MKLLHTSDWHLGTIRPGGMTYEADQRYALEHIYRIIEEEKVEGVLIAGDIFDKSIASQDAIRLYDETVTHICSDLGIPTYIIVGNHDGAERISQCSDLLKEAGLFIAGTLTETPQVSRAGGVDIYMLPWISTDKVRSVFPEEKEEINSLEDAYRMVLEKYRESFVAGNRNILLAHAFVSGGETSTSDRAAEIGGATVVGGDLFYGFDYVALGHLHGPQDVAENIRYSGSLMAYSFGREEKQEKSVTVIDTEDMSRQTIPIPQLHKRTTITGTFDEAMRADMDEDVLDGYVRLEITDSFVGVDSMASLRERYPNLLELTGKSFEKEESRITMTIDELDRAETDPEAVFLRYCTDILGEEPDDHLTELFGRALEKYGKEAMEE